MPISSMTGFARRDGGDATAAWTWEVKSVNGRGLDVRCRLATGFEAIEPQARERAAARFRRGNLQLMLSVVRRAAGGPAQVNREVLERVLAAAAELARRFPDAGPPSVDGLLAIKGVVEAVEPEPDPHAREARDASVLADLDAVLDALASVRAAEGARLAPMLAGHLDKIAQLATAAETLAAAQPDAIRERLKSQLATLLESVPALSPDRLAQEAALLATKADVREELDRLAAHIASAREMLMSGESVGRRLDFLCQEFNREANTLCSKAQDVELTRVGLELKATIEQFREQVQNIE